MLKRFIVGCLALFIIFCVSKAVAFQIDKGNETGKQAVNVNSIVQPKSEKQMEGETEPQANPQIDHDKQDQQSEERVDSHNNTSVEEPEPDQSTGVMNTTAVQNFTLSNLDGEKVHLSDYSGKTVILNYFGSWCAPCKQEIPDIIEYFKTHSNKDVVVILVDAYYYEFDGTNDVRAFKNKYHVPFEILLDKSKQVEKQFSISTIPTTIVINTKGKIANKHIGPVDSQWLDQAIGDTKK